MIQCFYSEEACRAAWFCKVPTFMKNLEITGSFKPLICRPGKVIKFNSRGKVVNIFIVNINFSGYATNEVQTAFELH